MPDAACLGPASAVHGRGDAPLPGQAVPVISPAAKETAMAKEFELTDEMRAQIGRASPPWSAEVTTTSVRAFARGVGYTDRVYFDIEAAKQAGYRSLPAPPTYL